MKGFTACQHCGVMVERSNPTRVATCFDCRTRLQRERNTIHNKKRVLKKRVPKEPTLKEWIAQHRPNNK